MAALARCDAENFLVLLRAPAALVYKGLYAFDPATGEVCVCVCVRVCVPAVFTGMCVNAPPAPPS